MDGIDKLALLQAGGVTAKSSYMSINAEELSRKLSAFPGVESAKAVKSFPDTLKITVVPMKPVAAILSVVDKKTKVLYIDKNGNVFGKTGRQSWGVLLPVVSGFVDNAGQGPRPGDKVSALYTPLFQSLGAIEKKAPALLDAISEIRVDKKPWQGYNILIFPTNSKVRVRLGETVDEETLRYMLLLLDVVKAEKTNCKEIDFRSGTAIYREKNSVNGGYSG
jgi:cell division protein FtsQ